MTDEERILWSKINHHSQFVVKFRRQHIVSPYILDFYSTQTKIAIELDGGQHAELKQLIYDKRRTKFLETKGIKVVRFWNHQITRELENCVAYVWDVCERRLNKK